MTLNDWNELIAKAQSDAVAQWDVGACLYDGVTAPDGSLLVRPNLRATVGWFRKSATAGNRADRIILLFVSGTEMACGAMMRRLFVGFGVRPVVGNSVP